MDSASHKLTERVLQALIKEKLLSESEARKLAPKLAEGRASADDWRLAVELSIPRKTKP
jgi:hypothetical protein